MIATKSIANRPISFDDFMLRLVKIAPEANTARRRAELLGVSENTYGTWKKRGTVPYKELVKVCIALNIDLNWFFKGLDDTPVRVGSNEMPEAKKQTIEDSAKAALEIMTKVLPEIERAQLPHDEETFMMLIKTYLNYKSRPGTDVQTILRAVAEAKANQ